MGEIDVESPIPKVDSIDLVPLFAAEVEHPGESESPPIFLPIIRRPPLDDEARSLLKPPPTLIPIERLWPIRSIWPGWLRPFPILPIVEEMPIWPESDLLKRPFLLSAFRSESPVGAQIAKYVWGFENGVVFEGPAFIYDFRDPGPHRVLLTIWDEVGRSRSLPVNIKAEPIFGELPEETFPGE